MAPKCTSVRCWQFGYDKEKLQSAFFNWTVERPILNKVREKNLYDEIAKIYDKNESSFHEIVKKEKEIPSSLAVISQIAKVMATVHNKCLVKMEKDIKFVQ